MTAPVRIAGFATLLVALFVLASLAGAALNPRVEGSRVEHQSGPAGEEQGGGH